MGRSPRILAARVLLVAGLACVLLHLELQHPQYWHRPFADSAGRVLLQQGLLLESAAALLYFCRGRKGLSGRTGRAAGPGGTVGAVVVCYVASACLWLMLSSRLWDGFSQYLVQHVLGLTVSWGGNYVLVAAFLVLGPSGAWVGATVHLVNLLLRPVSRAPEMGPPSALEGTSRARWCSPGEPAQAGLRPGREVGS
jgi:hypothetical protein